MKTSIVIGLLLLLAVTPNVKAEGSGVSGSPEDKQVSVIVSGMNRFAVDLYRKLAGEDGNLFFSPASLEIALAMTAAGAKGDTAAQMNRVLGLPDDPDRAAAGFGALLHELNNPRQFRGQVSYELIVANALWGQKGYPLEPGFINLLKASFDSAPREVDFKESEAARRTINTWVAGKTRNKIRDLVPAGAIDELTRLILTNAVYFKSTWASTFNQRNTKDDPFHLPGGSSVTVRMMHQTGSFGYGEFEDLQIAVLPYIGRDLSMVVFLPKETDGLAKLEKKLTREQLDAWLANRGSAEVDLSFPRFEYTSEFSMARTLREMGMSDAFSPKKADFSGISPEKGLAVSDVLHQAYVKVNEEGTEAAAATAIVMAGSAFDPRPPKVFKADHPFFFLIRHNKTGCILFLGRVVDPSKQEPEKVETRDPRHREIAASERRPSMDKPEEAFRVRSR